MGQLPHLGLGAEDEGAGKTRPGCQGSSFGSSTEKGSAEGWSHSSRQKVQQERNLGTADSGRSQEGGEPDQGWWP